MTTTGWGAAALERLWAIAASVAAVYVLATSQVGVNLWFTSGRAADLVIVLYGSVMLAVAAAPDRLSIHRVALPLSVVMWGGRAFGFLERVLAGNPDLWGAFFERLAMLVAVVTLHLLAVRQIGHTQALASRGLVQDRRHG